MSVRISSVGPGMYYLRLQLLVVDTIKLDLSDPGWGLHRYLSSQNGKMIEHSQILNLLMKNDLLLAERVG